MDVGTAADPSVFPHIAGSADVVNDGRSAVLAPTSSAGAGDADVVDGSERVRIKPIDTRIRLHFKQTQASVRKQFEVYHRWMYCCTHIYSNAKHK